MERIDREIKRRTDDALLRLVTAVLFEMRDEWMAFPRRYLPEGSMDEQGPPSFRAGPRGRVMYRRGTLDPWVHEQEQADSRSNTALNPVSAIPEQRVSRTVNT